jgi:hypothetical protein
LRYLRTLKRERPAQAVQVRRMLTSQDINDATSTDKDRFTASQRRIDAEESKQIDLVAIRAHRPLIVNIQMITGRRSIHAISVTRIRLGPGAALGPDRPAKLRRPPWALGERLTELAQQLRSNTTDLLKGQPVQRHPSDDGEAGTIVESLHERSCKAAAIRDIGQS